MLKLQNTQITGFNRVYRERLETLLRMTSHHGAVQLSPDKAYTNIATNH